jgi:hypothetical protein
LVSRRLLEKRFLKNVFLFVSTLQGRSTRRKESHTRRVRGQKDAIVPKEVSPAGPHRAGGRQHLQNKKLVMLPATAKKLVMVHMWLKMETMK